MSDARVTLPVETFALLLRTQITRFSYESDDTLVDICASENPQCQLTRDGGYVSLENLSSIFSPETDRRAHTTALPSEPPDSALIPEIASTRVSGNEIHTNEIIESELKNLFSILAPEANHRAEKTTPISEPADAIPMPEAATEQVEGEEIRPEWNSEVDETPQKVSKLKPILGGIGVVAAVVALIGYAVYSIQQAQFEIPAGSLVQDAGSMSSSNAAKPKTPVAQGGQGSQAAVVPQIKTPPGAWIDPATGLMWTLKDNRSDVNWQRAAEYCHNLRLAGHDDWRLPMIDELQGINDASISVPGHCCGGTQVAMQVKGNLSLSGWQWSSAQRAQYGTPFSFYNGGRYTNLLSDSDGGRALCVRTLGQLIAQPTSGAEE